MNYYPTIKLPTNTVDSKSNLQSVIQQIHTNNSRKRCVVAPHGKPRDGARQTCEMRADTLAERMDSAGGCCEWAIVCGGMK